MQAQQQSGRARGAAAGMHLGACRFLLLVFAMMRGKAVYLKRLTSQLRFHNAPLGESMEGATPPSVFVGRYGYPRVAAGPLIPPRHGDTSLMDTPERWTALQQGDVVDFRLNLVRGKQAVNVRERTRRVEALQEIALARRPFGMHASFSKRPRGFSFSEWHQPFGPSAPLRSMEFDANNIRWDRRIEKAYYDTDLLARDAVETLHAKDVLVSTLQKALSVGAFGRGAGRKLVPTRWSITAVDSMLAERCVSELKSYELIGEYMLFEGEMMQSYFAILLMPTAWQYEMIEAFIRILGGEEMVFGDWEIGGKKKYSDIGGCYYSGRYAIAEKLCAMRRQAGAIVFRESRPGYLPLGVWLVREAMRNALSREPKRFSSVSSALHYVESRMLLPFRRYRAASVLLKQRTIRDFAAAG